MMQKPAKIKIAGFLIQKKNCPSDNPLNFNEKIPLMTQSVLMGLDGGE